MAKQSPERQAQIKSRKAKDAIELLDAFRDGKRLKSVSTGLANCILDKMPEVNNNTAAYQTYKACKEKWPGDLDNAERPEKPVFFGYKSLAECVADKARETPSQTAANIIMRACRYLYGT